MKEHEQIFETKKVGHVLKTFLDNNNNEIMAVFVWFPNVFSFIVFYMTI